MSAAAEFAQAHLAPGPAVILCADDFALSKAVSAGIEELAAAGRLSATSAMVTFPEWDELGPRLAALRDRIAAGLHINLTVGAPLGGMPKLAPAGQLPTIGALTLAGARGKVDPGEIAAEVARQLEAFEQQVGCAPDFVDGHQHAHALPGVRKGVLAALRLRFPSNGPLVRDPSDDLSRIVRRGLFAPKAMQVAALATGFARSVRAAGLPVNAGFSGFSDFNPASPYARELEAGFTAVGPRHLMMCHPGHVDAELARRDRVTDRREQEFAALLQAEGLTARLWRPDRSMPSLWDGHDG